MDRTGTLQDDQTLPLRVFLVDSHADTRSAFTLYLQPLGHAVTSASTLVETLAAWPQAVHDVFISELRLADGDGCELLQRLSPCPRYAIAATSLGLPADRDRSRAAGFRRHLLKPFKPDELEAALHQAMLEIAKLPPADIHDGL